MKLLAGRNLFVLYLLAFAAVIYLVVALWADYARDSRGVALGADLPILAADEVPRYGINAALQDEDGTSRHSSLALLKNGGYAWVRQPFPWRDLELAKGVFAWQRWDRLVQDYREHGLRVLAVLDHPPAWSRHDNNWPNRPPDRFEDFGDFVAAFAERYRGQVDYLQIWDDPNIFPNWGNRAVDPAAYGTLLSIAYQRAKQANSSAIVLLAGLASNSEAGGRNMSDSLFLDALYRAGAGRYFDIAAAKPYGLWYRPDDRLVAPERTNFARVVRWREIMVAHGDGAKPIWAVEFGWNALPADWQGQPSLWGSVTTEEQAAFTVAALRRAKLEWPWLPVLILQGYPPPLPVDDPWTGFSVVNATGRPRPVYDAVRVLAASHTGAPVGFHHVSTQYVDLIGDWQRAGTHLTAVPPAVLQLRFSGTRLDLLVEQGPQAAAATVTVDGKPANRLPKVDGEAWLDAHSQRLHTQRVTLSDGLPAGDHELRVAVVSRQRLWPRRLDSPGVLTISGFFVIREPDDGVRSYLTLALALLAALLLRQLVVTASQWPGTAAAHRTAAAAWHPARFYGRRLRDSWQQLRAEQRDMAAFTVLAAATAALFVTPMPLAALGAVLLVAATWLRPCAAVFALIAAAPLGMVPLHVASAQVTAAEVLAVAAGFGLLGRHLAHLAAQHGPRHGFRAPPTVRFASWVASGFNGPIALLVFASITATLFADHQREALRELRTVILEPLVIYALILYRQRPAVENAAESDASDYPGRLIDTLVIVGAGVAAIGLYQYFFTDDVIVAEGVRRIRAFYGSPNNLGLFLGRIIPLAGCIAAGDRRRRWYLLPLALLLAALALSFSVGAWLGVTAAALFVAALQGRRVAIAASGGLAAAITGALAMLQVDRVISHLSLDQGTTRLRLLLWQGALNMLRDHPLLGVGPDNFLRHYRSAYQLPEAWREPDLSHPHNLLLDLWLRNGVAGLIAGLWSLSRFFAVGVDLYHRLADPARRLLVLGLLASMVDFVVHGFVDNSLFLVDLALVFWLSAAVLELVRREAYNSESVC